MLKDPARASMDVSSRSFTRSLCGRDSLVANPGRSKTPMRSDLETDQFCHEPPSLGLLHKVSVLS